VSYESARRICLSRFATVCVIALTALAVSVGDADARHKHKRKRIGHGPPPPFSHIVIDANTGKALESFKADEQRYPASLTKVMTLYLLFGRLEAGKIKLDTPLDVSSHAASRPPTKLGLKPGTTIRVSDAIKSLVTKSANDAAVVIAETLGGSEHAFAEMMTAKAHALGMSNTVYANASGLPNPQQVTTARDQAVLGRAIQRDFPREYKYFATSSFQFHGREIRTHNRLLGKVEGVDGIKTGYINASGYNLVSSVRRNHRHIVAVVFGGRTGPSRDAFMRKLIHDHIKDAAPVPKAPLHSVSVAPAKLPTPPARPAADVGTSAKTTADANQAGDVTITTLSADDDGATPDEDATLATSTTPGKPDIQKNPPKDVSSAAAR
jgi:D-alanyl-D-alanine carboxypeptidase